MYRPTDHQFFSDLKIVRRHYWMLIIAPFMVAHLARSLTTYSITTHNVYICYSLIIYVSVEFKTSLHFRRSSINAAVGIYTLILLD